MFRVGVGGFKHTELMRSYVEDIFQSERLTYGTYCKRLEKTFANLHDQSFGVLSNSGTSSLQVALQALKIRYGWQDGDEVIIPATTFVATANIVLHNNMVPVPVDIELITYNIDPSCIEQAITEKTRAIIPVHLFGQMANMGEVFKVSYENNLAIIEDSCETVFATHRGMKAGTWGRVGCFSFYTAHHIAAGVGGMAITSDADLARTMRSLVNHGRDGIYISMDDRVPSESLSRRFNFEYIGHSFRLTEFEAAIALAQMDTLEQQISRRQAVAAIYDNFLSDFPLVTPSVLPGNTHTYMMYPILAEGDVRDDLVAHLEENGIETRPLLPLINQPAYGTGWQNRNFPNARHLIETGFYIGCHPYLTDEDVDYVLQKFGEFYERG